MKKKVFVSTYPFSYFDETPLKTLHDNNLEVVLNSKKRPLSEEEICKYLKDADFYIAGTELISDSILQCAKNLKLISRVGIGLDGLNFTSCNKHNVRVTYTPEAPTQAVAELCVGMIIDLTRFITKSTIQHRQGLWQRNVGTSIYGKKVGLIGFGRIGKTLGHLLSAFNVKLLVHDIKPDFAVARSLNATITSLDSLLEQSDIVSLHIPLNKKTFKLMDKSKFSKMKRDAFFVNTARGNIVDEGALYEALITKKIAGAAIDVFSKEPYYGHLSKLDNCILTSHMGASTRENRLQMELDSVGEVVRFLNDEPLKNEVFSNE